jgi:hypothetical protein
MAWGSGSLAVRRICGGPPGLRDYHKFGSNTHQRQASLAVFRPKFRRACIGCSNQWLAFS